MANIDMDYSFDCAQLVAVRKTKSQAENINVCKLLSEIWGGSVITGDQIKTAKIRYVELFSESLVDLFEFEDKEFQGEFEDWKDAEQIPERVIQFGRCISELVEYGYDVERVFVIQTPSEIADRIYETKKEPLTDALYCKSLFHTGEGAGCEVLIVSLIEKFQICL